MNTLGTTNTVSESSDYHHFLDTINQQLEPLKQEYADPLDGILKYNAEGKCTTFFGDTVGPISLEDIQQQQHQMQQNIQNIQTIQNTLHETKNVPPSIKKVYSRSLQSLQAKFEMFQNALRIEAEKSGYPLKSQIMDL